MKIDYKLFHENGEQLDALAYPHLYESIQWVRVATNFLSLERGSVQMHRRMFEDIGALIHHGIGRIRFADGNEFKDLESRLQESRKKLDCILDTGGDSGDERLLLQPRDVLLRKLRIDPALNKTEYNGVLAKDAYPQMAEFGGMHTTVQEIYTVISIALLDVMCNRSPETCRSIVQNVPGIIDVLAHDPAFAAKVKEVYRKDVHPTAWEKLIRGQW